MDSNSSEDDVALREQMRSIAHDFNNVLATVVGTTDLMLLRLKADDPLRREVDEIRTAAQRGKQVARRLSALSRNERLEDQL